MLPSGCCDSLRLVCPASGLKNISARRRGVGGGPRLQPNASPGRRVTAMSGPYEGRQCGQEREIGRPDQEIPEAFAEPVGRRVPELLVEQACLSSSCRRPGTKGAADEIGREAQRGQSRRSKPAWLTCARSVHPLARTRNMGSLEAPAFGRASPTRANFLMQKA